MAESPVELGSVVAGRYRIDRVLGAGTMGVVVAAWHLELEQAVAIKFLNPSVLGATEALERFRREARAAARIKSEHVVRVLDVGSLSDGLPFIVMELLNGRSLEDELTVRGPFSVSEAVGHVLQVIDALAEAHVAGIVHRDLKPANLFLSERPDRSGVVKVLDFGISKVVGEAAGMGLTRTGMIVGSPLYMAPEQLRSTKSVDQRADIWALGTILFQLLTARTPYNAESAPDLYAMLLRDAPTSISLYRTDLPDGIESVILRCLERDPDRRFQNVGELAEALSPLAPPSSRIHVDRARRVLLGGSSPGSHQAPPPPVVSIRNDAPPPVPAQSLRVSTGGGGPLIVTNRKTMRSGGETHAQGKLWVPLGAAALLGLSVVGYFWARSAPNPPEVTTEVSAAQAQPQVLPVVEPPPAPAPAPAPASAPAAIDVQPAEPPIVTPAPSSAAVASAPPARHPAPVARAPFIPPKPAAPAALVAPTSAPQPSGRTLSNFGGRK